MESKTVSELNVDYLCANNFLDLKYFIDEFNDNFNYDEKDLEYIGFAVKFIDNNLLNGVEKLWITDTDNYLPDDKEDIYYLIVDVNKNKLNKKELIYLNYLIIFDYLSSKQFKLIKYIVLFRIIFNVLLSKYL